MAARNPRVQEGSSSAHMSDMDTMTKTKPVVTLNRYSDRCDRCGAQAYIVTADKDENHQLTWCNHHFSKHEAALLAAGMVAVVDESDRLKTTEHDRQNEDPHA